MSHRQTEGDTNPVESNESNKLNPEYPPYRENGRLYHGFHQQMYLFPCDAQEQDRLDIFHKLFSVAREKAGVDPLHKVPIKTRSGHSGTRPRILDLGCGTGIWAMDMANRFPDGFVLGIDLAAIQPPSPPLNCEFQAPRDYESPWTLGEGSWDMIHLQMGYGSVSSWPNLYRKVFTHLQAGGYFEQVEIRFQPLTEDGIMTDQPLFQWYEELKTATARVSRPIEPGRHTVKMLEDVGFEKVEEQQIPLPLNTWPTDPDQKDVGKWYNLAFSESAETLLLAPLTRISHWSRPKVSQLAADAAQQAYNKGCRAWHMMYIYTAQKPEE